MTRESYSALKQKIEKEILRLQKQAQALQIKQRRPVINSIIRSMREYDISPQEINEAYTARTTNSSPRSGDVSVAAPKRPVAPKYRDPSSGATWTGRGKAPRWIAAAESEGRDRNDFLIKT
ncbi:H-NS histone family protein [Candidimonas sp. SYP-B2681]|uniref:H-NS histone family protein n=1 Tax=Candidimonas sp. SYP-B2681 TaxID=2497686 RepID=UPI000F888DFD|nr:H-NS histone family protein [Candidimonas sp. SYP-B2681]RTZ40923.1 H-NS histone family protein [Candidimonas sp. SYP-B2681]